MQLSPIYKVISISTVTDEHGEGWTKLVVIRAADSDLGTMNGSWGLFSKSTMVRELYGQQVVASDVSDSLAGLDVALNTLHEPHASGYFYSEPAFHKLMAEQHAEKTKNYYESATGATDRARGLPDRGESPASPDPGGEYAGTPENWEQAVWRQKSWQCGRCGKWTPNTLSHVCDAVGSVAGTNDARSEAQRLEDRVVEGVFGIKPEHVTHAVLHYCRGQCGSTVTEQEEYCADCQRPPTKKKKPSPLPALNQMLTARLRIEGETFWSFGYARVGEGNPMQEWKVTRQSCDDDRAKNDLVLREGYHYTVERRTARGIVVKPVSFDGPVINCEISGRIPI